MWKNGADFKCFSLTHCYRHDKDSTLGKFLTELRTAPVLTKSMGEVDLRDPNTTLLCSRKDTAQVENADRLAMPDAVVTFYVVDRSAVAGEERVLKNGNSKAAMHTRSAFLVELVTGVLTGGRHVYLLAVRCVLSS